MTPPMEAMLLKYNHTPVGEHRGYTIWHYPAGSNAEWGGADKYSGTLWFEDDTEAGVVRQIDEAY